MTGQNDSIAVGIPGSHGGGHIFFDGDFDFEGQVKAEIGNAEAADAEDFADQVTAVYNCAQGKGEIGLLLCFIEPADGADRAGFFFGKAAVTDTFGIHSSSHSAAKAAFDYSTLAATPDNFTIFASEYDDAFLGSSNAFKANGLSAMFAGDLTPEEAAENIQAAYEEQAASYQ